MNILFLLFFPGGILLFLYGMHLLSTGLEKIAGRKSRKYLYRMTATPLKGLLFGTGVTMFLQSSSALSVMLIGLVDAGVMELEQTIAILMGSNIGTTLTAWLFGLAGMKTRHRPFFLYLFQPEFLIPLTAGLGFLLLLHASYKRHTHKGPWRLPDKTLLIQPSRVLFGFSLLFCGMLIMEKSVYPLANHPGFVGLLTTFKEPVMGILAGTLFTAIMQSSSASIGILQALSLTGNITYEIALPIIFGQNIGTCATALLSSVGLGKNAKRVGIIHLNINILGTIICLPLLYCGRIGIDYSPIRFTQTFLHSTVTPLGIALAHSIFNVASALLLMPFIKQLNSLSHWIIKDN